MFTRRGIQSILRTNNGIQFDPVKTREFNEISKIHGFLHIISSLTFSQSNGFVESTVKTFRLRIKQSADSYLPLMTYRSTPLENGFSAAEFLMGSQGSV